MIDLFDIVGRMGTSCLRLLPAELAHDTGMWLAKSRILESLPDPILVDHGIKMNVTIPGIGPLPHPFGLAAGFDKNCLAPNAFIKMGFSFIELGTITPLAQPGNPKPRMFRLSDQRAIINRMGFNSDGLEVVRKRLNQAAWTVYHPALGVNIGKNRDTDLSQAASDFVKGAKAFESACRYLVINISSPNTPGLRDLASLDFLSELGRQLGPFVQKSWVKLDPDLPRTLFQELVVHIQKCGFQGVVLSNTHMVQAPERGGLSGHPLLSQSNAMLEWAWETHQGSFPMIACGGVLSGIDAFHKIARGASGVQIYSALVYRGPGVVARLYEELSLELQRRGFSSVQEAIGSWYR